MEDAPAGWTVWSEDDDGLVLAFRPDVFDGDAFPAACMPTLYVTSGRRGRRPGQETVGTDWFVTLYLEPEVTVREERFDHRTEAVTAARELAAEFAAGEVDYRDSYQVPRDRYLDELDELTGRDDA